MSWSSNPQAPPDPATLPRSVLDPATAKDHQWPERDIRLVPEIIRTFGYIPDDEMLLPGDVVLVTPGSAVARLIQSAQRKGGFSPAHAMWTHAALYIGRGQIVEATPFGGVRVTRLLDMTFGRKILIRRHTATSNLLTRYQIAIEALTELHRGYSFSAVPRLAWLALRHEIWRNDHRPNIDAVTICSTLVRNAYARAARLDPLPLVTGMVWPADLSQTSELCDTPIGWIKLVTIQT